MTTLHGQTSSVSDISDDQGTQTGINRWVLIGALVAIIAASTAGNLHWLAQNIVLVGRDSGGHLERTLKAADLLTDPSIQTPFQLLTLHDYRPPLLYIAAQPFYMLFGRSMDSAQLTNVVLMVAVLLLTFALGRVVATDREALLATALVAFLPMMAGMARLFYMEHLLTTLLIANLIALLRCDGFSRRGWSLLWGATLGGALLVKWTSPIYIVLPTVYVLWRAGLFQRQWTALKAPRIEWRKLAIAAAVAVPLVAFWYLPSRSYALDEFLLGDWLSVFWLVLATLFIYAAQMTGKTGAASSDPTAQMSVDSLTNFWTGLLLGVLLASLWYLPRIDFLTRLGDVAFGTDRGNQDAVDLLRLENYTRYFQFWINEHMGLLPALLILPFALWAWIKKARRWQEARSEFIVLWLALLSAFLFLLFLAQANPRNLAPLTPIVAVLLADSLRVYPPRSAVALGFIWVAALIVQWSIYTFDRLEPVYAAAPGLWVSGDYAAWPASRGSDPGYWIQPDVLATIGNPEDEAASFGMLVDSRELHRGSFRYLILADNLNIELNPLTEPEGQGWGDMLANQWILLKDGDNRGVREPGMSVLQRIQSGDPLFRLLYARVEEYPLPDGDTATLYVRGEGPAHPLEFPVVLIETSSIAESINDWWSDAATLYFESADVATWVGIHDLAADEIVMQGKEGPAFDELLGDVSGTLMTATRYGGSELHDWLRNRGYYAREVNSGEFSLTVFGLPDRPLETVDTRTSWNNLSVTTLQSWPTLAPGEVLPVDITADGRIDGSLGISLRLIGPDGQPVAQNDRALLPQMRFGLFVPPDATPGIYSLAAVVYDPATLEPQLDRSGNDLGILAEIEVRAADGR